MAVLKFLFSFILCVTLINTVKADVIWPNLIISQGMYSIPSIVVGLIIEILFVKKYMNFDWLKSSWIGILLNAISGGIGYRIIIIGGMTIGMPIVIPIAYVTWWLYCVNILPVKLIFITCYGLSLIFCVAVNVLLKVTTLKILFKKTFKETYKWLLYANIIVIITIATLAFIEYKTTF